MPFLAVVDVQWRRHKPAPNPNQELDMSVSDLVQQLDSLVNRLQAETDRLEAANTHAESAMQERSNP